ncbi:MAG: RNA pseudouridine synthase [Planctomycetota bacterium]|nr:MAG: RNA pseudouridine synthase [Planctomycetota bacterium]
MKPEKDVPERTDDGEPESDLVEAFGFADALADATEPRALRAGDEDALVVEAPEEETGRRAIIEVRRKLPGRRLDKYLIAKFPRVSRMAIQRLIKQGDILVNGRPTKKSYEMEGGDVIEINFPPPPAYDVAPEPIPLDIVYEDDYVLALNKPAGIIVHPASRTQGGTIANGLAHYCKALAKTDDPFRPGIVHRLDKNTTGIMIVAKTDEAHWRLSRQFEDRTTQKVYLALVHGEPEFDEDIIDVPIGQHPTVHDRYVATGFAERMGGKFEKKLSKSAVTRYRVLKRIRGYSLVELHPKTGRTHQLRIHMSHIRHPIVGDPFYGGRHVSRHQVSGRPEDGDTPYFTRQLLHAARLTVTHPIHQKPLTVSAPLASDMREFLRLLGVPDCEIDEIQPRATGSVPI